MNNPLTLIPALYRKYVYAGYGVVLLVMGAFDVGFDAAEAADPTWFVVASAVVTYLGIPVAALAASNMSPSDTPKPAPRHKGLL